MDGGEEQHDEKQEGGKTALLPKSIFPHEPEVGDVCQFRVEAIHDEEISVAYEDEKGEKEEQQNSESPELAGSAPPPAAGGGGMFD
jgi:hypothetical protein